MKYFFNFIPFFALVVITSLGFNSCTESELKLKSKFDGRMSLNLLANNLDIVIVQLNLTSPISGTDSLPPVTNALVIINGPTTKDTLKYDGFSNGYTKFGFTLLPNTTYKISASKTGLKTATSELTMPALLSSSSIAFNPEIGKDASGFSIPAVTLNLTDVTNVKNYYLLRFYYWNVTLAQWETTLLDVIDPNIKTRLTKLKNGSWLLNDNSFQNSSISIVSRVPIGSEFQTPKYKWEIENLENNYFQYLRSIEDYSTATELLQEPQQVWSNITNGVGIFAGSTKTVLVAL